MTTWNNKPLVSVVITVYNRQQFISAAIQSVLSQDYENFELIISNNASTDDSHRIISAFLTDKRVKYFQQARNIGMTANFKFATGQAAGKYITYVSSDDYLISPSFITDSIDKIATHPDVKTVLSTYNRYVEDTGVETKNVGGVYDKSFYQGREFFLKFPEIKSVSFAGALMDTEALKAQQVFDEPGSAFDVLAILKLSLISNVATINKPGYMLRIHGKNLSTLISIDQAISNFSYIDLPYEKALELKLFSPEVLNNWRDDVAFFYCRYITVQFIAQDINEYRKLIKYISHNYPRVLTRLRRNLKWQLLTTFFKRPDISQPLLKILSKPHYNYLKSLREVKGNFTDVKL